MNIMLLPFERVVDINAHILSREPGMKGSIDINKLCGALSRLTTRCTFTSPPISAIIQ